MSALQDLLVTPIWMALVWVVHALCVMLEWCFTLNLLDSPLSGGVGRGLRQMQQALTDPWIPAVLAVACVLVVYDGLVRRRVADTLGQALLMVAMMVGGLWAIADPGSPMLEVKKTHKFGGRVLGDPFGADELAFAESR